MPKSAPALCRPDDRYCTIAEAAKSLGTSVQKIKQMIEDDMLLWEQPITTKKVYVEVGSLMRLKYPEKPADFFDLHIHDPVGLQKAIDLARHKIGDAAGLPPEPLRFYSIKENRDEKCRYFSSRI